MEGDYEDSRKEYFSLLDSHVGKHLSRFTEFMNLLKSDLAVDRFVPKEWTGIQGFPSLDIQVKDNFPAFHKVRSRPSTLDFTKMRRKSLIDSISICIDLLILLGHHLL